MSTWESLKLKFKNVFGKNEPVVEEEKKEEKIVVTIPARIAGVYNLYTESKEFEEYYHHHSERQYKRTLWFIHMNVKAMAEITLDGVKTRFKIEDSIEVSGYYRSEDDMYRSYMKKNETLKKVAIEEGLRKLVIKKFNEEKLKDFKEQFANLGKVEFDIKIEVNEEELRK